MKIKYFLILTIFIGLNSYSQNFTGMKFCLDPGHGSPHGSTCEPETKRFEAYVNHIVMPYLKQFLRNDGATVISTRADYDSLGPCMTLSEREAVANNNNVDFFHAIHHNAFNGTANYSLVLFEQLNGDACPNGNPQWPNQADSMAFIMAAELYAGIYTTTGYGRGDFCFLGYNLGVLNDLNMPGVLSEGSFFDNIPEATRLANLDYLRTEAEAQYLSYLKYFKKPLPATGSLVGIVNNRATGQPVSGVTVKLTTLNKSYTVDMLGNGFYRFDSLAPGTYPVTVISNIDTVETNVVVQAGKINKQNLTSGSADAPTQMKLLSVTGGDGSLNITWGQPTGVVDSVQIFINTTGEIPSGAPYITVPANSNSYSVTGLDAGKGYYVGLKGKNTTGVSAVTSKIYGAYTSAIGEAVLIVDGFNRYGGSGSWQLPYHNFASFYGSALNSFGRRFSTVSNQAITSSAQIKPYKFIFWFLGDESTADETFSDTEQGFVKDYLKAGGNFFVTGAEVAWDLDSKGSASDKAFFNQYLKASYVADNPTPNTPSASGLSGTIFNGIPQFAFGNTYPEDYPDVINPLNGSVAAMQYNASQKAAVTFDGTFPDGTNPSKLVYIAFPVETIGNVTTRNLIIQRIMDFFTGATSVDDGTISLPLAFSMSVYPNPFNPSANLSVNLIKEGVYRISIYDILGREVGLINDAFMQKGAHKFNIEMGGHPSGTYFVHIFGEGVNEVQKIMLIK